MAKWDELASDQSIEKTAAALRNNGMSVIVVDNGVQAKSEALKIIPKGAEIMDMTSVTLDDISVSEEIAESGNYMPVRSKFSGMDKNKQKDEMQKLGAAPIWSIGSVHAITEDGNVVVASATGSQLPAYAYGSQNVIWVVSTQKIVKNIEDALTRIYDHVFPLEDARAKKAYGVGSGVNKLLIINKEVVPNRITVILVKEKLGF